MRRLPALLATLALAGCATGAPTGGRAMQAALRHRAYTPAAAPRALPSSSPPARAAPAPAAGVRDDAREKVVAAARSMVGKPQVVLAGKRWPTDCTGLVEGAYAVAGQPLRGAAEAGDNGVTAMYRHAQKHGRVYTGGRPLPGDLVFFRETYDQNRDGRLNDGLTHVGIVEDVDAAGTVTVIHRVSRGVVRYRMNLARPELQKDPRTGAVLNDRLRAPGRGRPQVLTGQLFAAYATLLPVPDGAEARR